MSDLVAVVDSRIWLPPDLPKGFTPAIRAEFKHGNPEFFKKRAMGFATWGVPQNIVTSRYIEDDLGKRLTLPRGGMQKLRMIASDFDMTVRVADRRTTAPVSFPMFRPPERDGQRALRWYQAEAIEIAEKMQQGIIRAPTGSGKTMAALALIARLKQRAIVIMRDTKLMNQWLAVAEETLGIDRREIGQIKGGKLKEGERLTLALQQTLYKRADILDALLKSDPYGAVIVDEVQTVAARTFQEVIDLFPCRYRIGVSADETRRDKREFLIYDMFGRVIYEIDRQTLENEGVVHAVTARVVPTDFMAEWYVATEEKDFTALLAEMVEDEERNRLAVRLVGDLLARDEVPILVFTHRREHVDTLVEMIADEFGIPVGSMRGGNDKVDEAEYEAALEGLKVGRLKVAVGTFHSIGTGIDIPLIRSGVCATPISEKNKQFFGQVRGRICRTSKGKDDAHIYMLWDRHVFPDYVGTLKRWNDKRVQEFDGRLWKPDLPVR